MSGFRIPLARREPLALRSPTVATVRGRCMRHDARMAGRVPDPPIPDSLAARLRDVVQAAHDASGGDRDTAMRLADEWCRVAVEAGWSGRRVAEASGATRAGISERVRRAQGRSDLVRPAGVPMLPPAPAVPTSLEPPVPAAIARLVPPAVAAQIAGCATGSLATWARRRGVTPVRRVEGGRRMYDADAVRAAASQFPTRGHRRAEGIVSTGAS